jgi:hypothetical protein
VIVEIEGAFAAGRAQSTQTLGGVTTETRRVDGHIYVQLGVEVPGIDTPWVGFPAKETGEQSSFPATEPADYFPDLTDLGVEPRVVGSEEIRGVLTDEYQVRLADRGARRYLERTGGAERAEDVDALRLTVSVWVDEENLVRRMQTLTTVTRDGERTDSTTTTELFDFNAAFAPVEAPPANQVTSFESSGAAQEWLRSLRPEAPRVDLNAAATEHFCAAHDLLTPSVADLSPTPSRRAVVDSAITRLDDAIDAVDGSGPQDRAARARLASVASAARGLVSSMRTNSRSGMKLFADRVSAEVAGLEHNCA